MIDSNERLAYLNSRNTDKLIERMIDSTLNAFLENKGTNQYNILSPSLLADRQRSLKNALFIKFCNIEFEGIFQSYSVDRKMDG